MRVVKYHDERRQEILDTARKLFLQNGTENTSVAMLVRQIGVAQGLFYYYFKSKEEIMDAVLAQMVEEFSRQLEACRQEAGDDFVNQLRALIRLLVETYETGRMNDPENWLCVHYRRQVCEHLYEVCAGLLAEGLRQGQVTAHNPQLLFQIIIGGSLLVLERQQVHRETIVEMILQILGLSVESH